MKKLLLAAIFILVADVALAQNNTLPDFNRTRINTTRTGMLILGSWAVANLVSSPVLAGRSSGSQKYFYQMNGYWNLVNLGIAGISYLTLVKQDPAALSLAETFAEQQKMEKILLFNAGLDIGYILGGLYLREKSQTATRQADRLRGFGNSIMLQGAFLFTFDLLFFLSLNQHGNKLMELLKNVSISTEGVGIILKL